MGLLAIVLGIVGGLIALLLIAILVTLIIGQRMKVVQQTSAIQEHGYDDLPPLYVTVVYFYVQTTIYHTHD